MCYHTSPWAVPGVWDHNPIINGLIVNHGRLATLVDIIDPRTARIRSRRRCGAGGPPQGASANS